MSVPANALRSGRSPHRVEWLDRTGLAIVIAASVIQALNDSSQSLVTRPVAVWLESFLDDLWVTLLIGLAMFLAGRWACDRHPKAGRAQYVSVLGAVFVTAILAAIALEVHFYIFVVILLAALWVRHRSGHARYAAATIAVAVAVLLGAAAYEMGPPSGAPNTWSWALSDVMVSLAQDVARYAAVGMVIAGAWLYTRTEADHAAAIAQCAVDSARLDEQTAEARLQMLEAQIEPHFLFNTLAHVKRLYETDPAAGARMLRNLESYLAVALPQMRASDSTLGRELDHATAYLDIQQIRMGRRLAYMIDIDEGLRGARLPPLMLLTLVENAIKHGLTPVPGGGRIDVRARVDNSLLRVEVADTGGGFTRSGGKGAGLANIRARLAAQFGRDANLALALNSPSGVVATITLPCRLARAASATA